MSEQEVEWFDDEGKRIDGREKNEMRETSMEAGVLTEADGSAMIEVGNTRVVASVFGP